MKKGIAIALFLMICMPCMAQNLLNGPEDMIYYPADECFYVSNWAGNSIIRIDQDSNQTLFKSSITHAHGMLRDGDTLYVASNSYIKKIDLQSSTTVQSYYIVGAQRLGHITTDNNSILYASDWNNGKIFRLDLNTGQSQTLATDLPTPVGISYDEENARLILCCMEDYAPVRAVDITTGIVTEIAYPNLGSLDAITEDDNGYYYISVWSQSAIYKFDHDFLNTPELISSGHNGPSGLEYYPELSALGVTNYNSNSVSLIYLGTSVDDPNQHDKSLCVAYPNPLKQSISFELHNMSMSSNVRKSAIYNSKGQHIIDLNLSCAENCFISSWNGHDSMGRAAVPGVYFVVIENGKDRITKKLLLIK